MDVVEEAVNPTYAGAHSGNVDRAASSRTRTLGRRGSGAENARRCPSQSIVIRNTRNDRRRCDKAQVKAAKRDNMGRSQKREVHAKATPVTCGPKPTRRVNIALVLEAK